MRAKGYEGFLKSVRKYGRNSLLLRNAVRIMLIILLPVALVLLWVLQYGGSILDDSLEKANLRTLYRAQVMMDTFITDTIGIGERLYSHRVVTLMANRPRSVYPNFEEIELRKSVVSLLEYSKTEYIESIYIYSQLNNFILTANEAGPPNLFTDTGWLDTYHANRASPNLAFFSLNSRGKDSKQLCYFRPLRVDHEDRFGLIAITLRQSKLDQLLRNLNGEDVQEILFADKTGAIVYAADRQHIGRPIAEYLPDLNYAEGVREERQTVTDAHGKEYICNVLASTVNDWRYVSLIPSNEFSKGRDAFYSAIALLFVACLALALLCTVFVSAEAYRPVALIREMLSDPMSVTPETLHNDELRYILGSIYTSSGKSAVDSSEIKARMELINKARISALQAQINPHFLYNTLQAIMFVFIKETGNADTRSVDLIEQLSSLIRETTQITRALVTLEEEMSYIGKYLVLQKARFGDALVYRLQIPAETLRLRVPKMSLQPLVENAFIHGQSFKAGHGLIDITAQTDGDTLRIEVTDNGGGLPMERMEAINSALAMDVAFQDTHIGLNNVNARLRLIFGEEARLWLKPAKDGLTVSMSVPVKAAL